MNEITDAERIARVEAAAELLSARIEALEAMAEAYAETVGKMAEVVHDLTLACKDMATEVASLRGRALRVVQP